MTAFLLAAMVALGIVAIFKISRKILHIAVFKLRHAVRNFSWGFSLVRGLVGNGNGGFLDDDSGGQSYKDAQEPYVIEVKAQAPPSADDQKILDFANDLNKNNIQDNIFPRQEFPGTATPRLAKGADFDQSLWGAFPRALP